MRPTVLILAAATTSVVLMLVFRLIGPSHLAWLTGDQPPDYPVAAELDLIALDGESLSSAHHRGQILVLDFWATWCGPCIAEIAGYNALQQDYAHRGVRLAGVALRSGTAEDLRDFASAYGIEYPLAVGSDQVWRRFGPTWGLPTTLIIDRKWRLRRVWTGAGGRKMEQIRATLELLVDEGVHPGKPW